MPRRRSQPLRHPHVKPAGGVHTFGELRRAVANAHHQHHSDDEREPGPVARVEEDQQWQQRHRSAGCGIGHGLRQRLGHRERVAFERGGPSNVGPARAVGSWRHSSSPPLLVAVVVGVVLRV